ncbi:hypothetical protein VCUG_01563 [Vavraia culicis subsp. floridensis]|uniref:Uncharacterized protein n=1 Tax=Vavraia culicis (isolate floridensis) TaxID=948595 RepID=L2GTK7_VAVCU|nr:uncharacterized protein VCUG_01563 [Vavraia culicis subsp. floridensis]ELA46944.1 hypothetical protein VCUG_01563 [Vavraia culicis subsp. floridensis]
MYHFNLLPFIRLFYLFSFIFHSFMLFFIFIRNTSFKAAIRIDRLGACHEDVMLADKSDVFSRTHDEVTMNRKTCAKDEKVALADYNTGACTDLEDFMADDTECVMKAGKIEHTYPSSIDLSIFLFKNFSAHQKRTFLRTYARIYSAIAPRLSVLDRVVRRTSNDKKEQLAHYMTVHVLRYGNVKRRMRYAFRCVYGCNEVVSMVLSVIGFVVNLWCGWGVLREKTEKRRRVIRVQIPVGMQRPVESTPA